MSGHRALRDADLPVLALACALFALWSNRWSGADFWLSSQFYDAASGGFALRRDMIWSRVLHEGVKWLTVAAWLGGLAVWSVLRWRRPAAFELHANVAFVLRVSLAAVLAVNLLRSQSVHSCPWHLAAFGGDAAFFRLFDSLPDAAGPGRCLPSGHAASLFMWLAVLPVMSGRPRAMALCGILLLGAAAGAVQIVRGAHFASHILLTASACAVVVYLAALARRFRSPE